MVRVLVVLRGGYPWGFRMQGGGDKPLIVSKVTSTGKAGGAGVRAGCAVKAINGTPTAQLSLSHAHALTKQGSTLTLEIDDTSEEPRGATLSSNTSICSSNSTSTSSTVVAANGHISSSRRRTESGGSEERARDTRSDHHSSDRDKSENSDTRFVIHETYEADRDILRSDPEDDDETSDSGTEASEDSPQRHTDSSLNLSNISGDSNRGLSGETEGSNESDEGSSTDQGSQTDTSTDTLVADVIQYQADLVDLTEAAFVEYDQATGARIEHPGTQVTYNEYGHTLCAYQEYPKNCLSRRVLNQTFCDLEGYSTLHETFCEKDEITGALIEHPNDSSDEEIQPHFYEDSSSFTENGDSFFLNFEEELEQAERQYPNLQVEHLLINQEKEEEDEPKVEEIHWWGSETAKEVSRYSTITEEGEEEEIVVVVPRGKLETTAMGQYYSSASGGGPSGGEVSGSLASSLRSSEEWRISLASTVTVASTATADSDDTLAKDMSELSSVNSRLSSLDEAQDEVKGHPIVDSNVKGMIQTDHRRQTSIRDAIDELESIEQAAQTLLQNQQFSTDDGRGAPVSDTHTINSSGVSFTEVNLSAKLSPLSKRKLPQSPLLLQDADNHETLPEKSEKTPQLGTSANNKTETVSPGERVYQEIPSTKADKDGLNQKTENLCYQENVVINGDSKTTTRNVEQVLEVKAEVKPPLPPTTGSQLSKFEVKRRFLSRSKELKPYISRESYNDELVLKDLERLRRSYQEGDLNDFLDALENTPISDDIEEAFLRQLLVDISENVEGLPQESEDSSEPKEETEIVQQKSSAQPENEVPTEPSHGSSSASTLENVKERIREIITIRKAGRVIGTGNCEEPSIQKDDSKASTYPSKEDLCPSETLQTSRPITPQSLRPDTPNSKSSRPQTPDSSTKGDDGKKSFNIAEFLKKGSPKYLREKYKERKNRKSDVITTSESESEDPDGGKKDIDQGNSASQKNGSLTEYQSSLKGSNRSLNSSQELKKEVRFEFDTDGQRREVENSNCKDSTTDSKISEAVELKIQHTCIGPQVITYEAQQQETVVLKETTEELESEAGFTLPSTVEDINNLAQTLLPRLPERVKPSRKKKKLIPASVEELSTGDIFNSTSTLASNGLQKADTVSLIINTTVKEESPPPLPHYEELLELPKTSTRCVAVVERDRSESHSSVAREESEDSRVTNKNTVHTESPQRSSSIAMTQLPDCTMTSSPSVTTVTPDHITTTTTLTSSAINAASESVAADSTQSFLGAVPSAPTLSTPIKTSIVTSATDVQVLVSPLTVTPVASISVAPTPENATLLVYPARTLPLPVIPESLQEDQVSLPTPSEPTVSFSSHGGSAPVTPQDEEENVPSLYDNVNPFKEMREMESKPLQDVAPEPLPVTKITVEIETETTEIETITLSQQLKDENLSHHFSLPQEACKSPDSEKSLVVDIDALTALTAEMFSFAHDMDKCLPHKENDQLDHSKASAPEVSMVTDTLKSDNKSEYLTDRGSGGSVTACVAEVSEAAVSTTYLTKQQEDIKKKKETKETVTQTELDDTSEAISVKERAKSNTIAIQTDATRYVRTYEASSQTDTEYETDFETESEMEENSSSRYDVSKWLFQPAREKKLPLSTPKDPQLQELHKQQQAMIMELQQQCLMQERRQREKPEVPPRQFQEKMPLKVVDELKTVLSEVEEVGAKLKKVADPSPHWDSDLKWNNALQELGLDESTLLSEIEQILGFGSLTKNRTEKPANTTTAAASSSRPESFEKPVKSTKPNRRKSEGEKPVVPERDSSKGVWSPGRGDDASTASGPSRIELPDLPSFKDQPTVWSPVRAGSASPSLGRKEYRKVTYDGTSTLQRRPSQENVSVPKPEESFAWKDINVEKVARSPTSSLPKVQNPTVTLLQKKREGQIPGKRPEYLKPDDIGPKYKPDDKLYVIKREYESEDEEGGRRFAVLGPKKVQGVGPTTTEGVPTTLKSGVKSEHQGEWYRRMFDSLHKVKDDDHIIIKYKVPRARYGGYLSEPEGYDSDIGSSRYATLDRRRQHHFEVDPMTSSLPRNTNRYVHQPGRIEDYIPGYSSLSEKELKKNPEADVKLESQSQEPPPVSVNHRYGSQKMSMTHALKESGYESDSTLVFRKREDARRQAPDPRKTSQVYRQIQRGGDIPFTGLQKTNPPKPRESPYKYESGEVNIHYRTPVRIEQKEAIPEEELARRQEEHMKKVYENERRKKYLAELEDIERRRHTDNFTPLQKSPIPLNRYDDESSLGTMRGARTPDLKQVAKSLYNFTAQNKRELSFNKGEVIFIRRQIDKNWYEGELRGSVGIFPCNYVEIVPYESIKTLTRKPTEGQARARFNFQAQTSMEMSLSKGELVVLTRRVDENWYEGRIGNRKGIFPVSYVDTLVEPGSDRPMTPSSSPMPRPALPAANLLYNGASSYSSPYSTLGRPGSQNDSRPYNQSLTVNTQQEPVAYRALYNYKPQNDDELELLESDVVMVMEKCDDGWFVGTSRRTGLFGTFPGNYVERV